MRQPIAAGQFYPEKKEQLKKEIKSFIIDEKRENTKAAIVPHAGYSFSGKTAGKTFSLIPNKKDFIILGVNHSGLGKKVSLSLEKFSTPLGEVKNNDALGENILTKLSHQKIESSIDESAHRYEHSIEVELPFLQLTQNKFEIIPLVLKELSYEECKKIAETISKFINEKEFLLVSSDFTHYGKPYGFTPFDKPEINFKKYDSDIILEILELNGKNFYKKASSSTVCGIYGITILIELAKIKGWKAKLIDYSTSADVSKDWKTVVGYAGIIFE